MEHHEHPTNDPHESTGRRGGRRRKMHDRWHHHGHGHHHLRGPAGHGRRRARRGAVGASILALLDEKPMYGYELIGELEQRSGGRWKPSAGSIYPALGRLEHRGLIQSTDDDGKRRFELTGLGREQVEAHRAAGNDAPWDDHGLGDHGDLRRAVAELVGPAKQIGRFGSPEQSAAAVEAIKQATAALYQILADGPGDPDDNADATGTDAGEPTDD